MRAKTATPQRTSTAILRGDETRLDLTSHDLRGRRLRVAPLLTAVLGVLLALLYAGTALAVPGTTSTSLVLQGEAKEQVEELRGQADAVQSEIDTLDTRLEEVSESYNRLNVDLERLNQELTTLRRKLRETEDLHTERQARLNKRLSDTYKSGGGGGSSLIALLLVTEDFSDFVKRLILITKVTAQDQDLVANVRGTVDDMGELGAQIEAKKSEALTVRQQLDRKQEEIEGLLAERTAVLDGLDTQIAGLIEQERQRQEAERARLEAEFRSKLAGWQRYDGPLPQTDDAVLNQLVQTAATYLGIPYVWAGERPSTGFDCSGLLLYAYRQHGVILPHYSGYQAQMGVEVSLVEIMPGDLIAFGSPVHHVGMYVGDGLFVHAPRTGDVVKLTPLSTRSDINTIRRFPVQARTGPVAID
ncbi:MAG: C40 family peptidase [Thermoleophilia bacterium]